jgi:hypothetical protein
MDNKSHAVEHWLPLVFETCLLLSQFFSRFVLESAGCQQGL